MNSLQGKLLLAAPVMQDPNFAKSVVLIIRHDEDGALGLVLNRPTGVSVREAIASDSGISCQTDAGLLRGGPCEGPLMALHQVPELAEQLVLPDVYFSVETDLVQDLLTSEDDMVRYFHGYAGWSAGQLDAELTAGGWLMVEGNADNVFEPGMDSDAWAQLMKQRGREELKQQINPDLIPPDPTVN